MLKVWVRFERWFRSQEGQALSEYGLVIALVAVAAIAGLIAFREEIKNTFTSITEAIKKN